MEVVPSYHGYIETNTDALLLTQAVLDAKLNPVTRRPYEIERPQLIISGNVFVFIEEKSGIKRWTDGVSWSPSRIMGKFLVYRELDKQNSANTCINSGITTGNVGSSNNSIGVAGSFGINSGTISLVSGTTSSGNIAGGSTSGGTIKSTPGLGGNVGQRKRIEPLEMIDDQRNTVSKALVGSLNSSYAFKPGGLVKKTMSLKLKRCSNTETIHIISYYMAEDVESGKLVKPSNSPFFAQVRPCRELVIALDNSSVGNSRSTSASSQTPVIAGATMNVVTPTTGSKGTYSGGTVGQGVSTQVITPPVVNQPLVGTPSYTALSQLPTYHHPAHMHTHHHHHQTLAQQTVQGHQVQAQHQYYNPAYYPTSNPNPNLTQPVQPAQLYHNYSGYYPQSTPNMHLQSSPPQQGNLQEKEEDDQQLHMQLQQQRHQQQHQPKHEQQHDHQQISHHGLQHRHEQHEQDQNPQHQDPQHQQQAEQHQQRHHQSTHHIHSCPPPISQEHQMQQLRPCSSSTSSIADISQLTTSSVASSTSQPHNQFTAPLPHPAALFLPEQQKSSSIQLPLPFPHGPSTAGQTAASSVQQTQHQKPHSSMHSATSPTSTSYIPYPGYNVQHYIQTPAIYPVSRYNVGSGPLPLGSQIGTTASSNINPSRQQLYNYSSHEKAQLGSASHANKSAGPENDPNATGSLDKK